MPKAINIAEYSLLTNSVTFSSTLSPELLTSAYSQAKAGTTAFHAYATLSARVRNKRYTLAVRRLTDVRKSHAIFAAYQKSRFLRTATPPVKSLQSFVRY